MPWALPCFAGIIQPLDPGLRRDDEFCDLNCKSPMFEQSIGLMGVR
jgi:hypothetical protein